MLPRRGQPKSLFRISSFSLITTQKTDGLENGLFQPMICTISEPGMHHIRAW